MHKTTLKVVFCLVLCLALHAIPKKSFYSVSSIKNEKNLELYPSRIETFEKLLQLQGGKVTVGKKIKKKSMLQSINETINQVQPATRFFLFLVLLCTLIHITGLPAPAIFSINKAKLYEIWRPFTSVTYLGAPSMSMANSIYFLIRYGQALETENGTGAHAWFLLVQTFILTVLGLVFGFPFQAQAMIAAIIYVSSRVNPMEKMFFHFYYLSGYRNYLPFQFGLLITCYQLPFFMMAIDCLSQQSIAAAWPHLLGIFSGHTYHFFTEVWPKLGGRAWLNPPKWILKNLGGDKKNSNVKGIDFRKGGSNSSSNKNSKKKSKILNFKRKKGRKLGSSNDVKK